MTGAAPLPALAGAWEPLDAARRLGVVEAVRELLPAGVDPAVYAVTQLGDVWLLLVALSLFLWYGSDRRRGALALAVALGGMALVVGLKALFALPRPPEPYPAHHVDGYGFPSGHATASTVAWGAMAWLSTWSTRQRRVALAAGVVVTVGLSRVLLGVHYLGSVLAGFAAGVVFLAGALWVSKRDPLRAFAVAAAVALAAVAAGAVVDGLTLLGGTLGGALTWSQLDVEGAVHPVAAAGGLALFGGLWAVAQLLDAGAAVLFVTTGAVVGGLLAWPAIGAAASRRLPAQNVSR